MRTVLAVAAFALAAAETLAQQPLAPLPPPRAPVAPATVVPAVAADQALPGGKDVSQPLQPVSAAPTELPPADPAAPAPPAAPEAVPVKPEPVRGPLGPTWDAYELLYWWPLRQPVPALAYGSRTGLPPAPGARGTSLLLGGSALDSQPSAGGRFTWGYSLNAAQTFGVEATYLFLGSRTFTSNASNFPGTPSQSIGIPYTDAATGAGEVLTLGQAGASFAALSATTSVRVQGWEVNTVANVYDGRDAKLNFLMGWRYFQVNEWLRLDQGQYRYAPFRSVAQTAEQFDAHNRFNGGQLGLHADVRRGVVFCEMTGKVAFGQTYEVVKADGVTRLLVPGSAGPVPLTFPGSGLYAGPSNVGRTASGAFAVVPEGTVKFGFRLGDAGRVYVGYSFIYLSDAVRPGDQVDRAFTPSQLPLVSGSAPVASADRPARLFNHSDFWVQGLVIGLETRY
jgi:hypothetical protein